MPTEHMTQDSILQEAVYPGGGVPRVRIRGLRTVRGIGEGCRAREKVDLPLRKTKEDTGRPQFNSAVCCIDGRRPDSPHLFPRLFGPGKTQVTMGSACTWDTRMQQPGTKAGISR